MVTEVIPSKVETPPKPKLIDASRNSPESKKAKEFERKMLAAIDSQDGNALGEMIFDAECEGMSSRLDMEYFEIMAFELN